MKPRKATRRKAKGILDGIQQITRNEMLVIGQYNTDTPDPDKKGQVCGGFKACLIGSAYLSAGIKPKKHVDHHDGEVTWALPGTSRATFLEDEDSREIFLATRPALRLAVRALDEAAGPRVARVRKPERKNIINAFMASPIGGVAEGLFESQDRLDRNLVVELCDEAKTLIDQWDESY
jgi:hypothetical protein